jgi:ribosomal-protein-serine acetyltransferase
MPSLSPRVRYTPRYILRPFRRRDGDALYEAVEPSLRDLAKWLPWAHGGYSRAEASRFVRDSTAAWSEGRAYDFTIRDKDDPDRHLGNISVWYTSRQNPTGEIGYWIRSDAAGKGVCTEVTAAVCGLAFDELRMHRVVLRIAVGNRASERVAEKLGFVLEGTLRDEVKVGDTWMDHTVWGLLEPEYRVERKRYEAEGWV